MWTQRNFQQRKAVTHTTHLIVEILLVFIALAIIAVVVQGRGSEFGTAGTGLINTGKCASICTKCELYYDTTSTSGLSGFSTCLTDEGCTPTSGITATTFCSNVKALFNSGVSSASSSQVSSGGAGGGAAATGFSTFTQNSWAGEAIITGTTTTQSATILLSNTVLDYWTAGQVDASATGITLLPLTAELLASADSRICGGSTVSGPTVKKTNYGSENDISIYTQGGDYGNCRALVKFDISALPSSGVQSATLKLYQDPSSPLSSDRAYEVYRVSNSWTESGVTWKSRDGTNSWTAEGGDYDTLSDTQTFGTSTGWHSFTIPTNIIGNWQSYSTQNYGLLIKDKLETGSAWNFIYSKEKSTDYGPQLVLKYSSVYQTPGILYSPVFDSGFDSTTWGTISWTATTETGTSVKVSVRGGCDTAASQISMLSGVGAITDWTEQTTNGGTISLPSTKVNAPCIQYMVQLATTDTTKTPTFKSITITYKQKTS